MPSSASAFTVARTIQLAVEFGFVIAVPLVGLGLLGKWLDGKTGHENLFTLIGILVALVCSTVVLSKRISGIRRELMQKGKNEQRV